MGQLSACDGYVLDKSKHVTQGEGTCYRSDSLKCAVYMEISSSLETVHQN